MRVHERPFDALRKAEIIPHPLEFADASVRIEMGKTQVLVAATVEEKVPSFMKGNGTGWITAEYALLPRSTEQRTSRERGPGRISGRTQEIQRLIGRSLRAVTDLTELGERTVILDCDVIQADGGTRSAAITGGSVALALALKRLMDAEVLERMPLKNLAGAVSVGIVDGELLLDLDYSEDSRAEMDMNVVITDSGQLIEVQASAEKKPFSKKDFNAILELAEKGIAELIGLQKDVLKKQSLMFMAYSS